MEVRVLENCPLNFPEKMLIESIKKITILISATQVVHVPKH